MRIPLQIPFLVATLANPAPASGFSIADNLEMLVRLERSARDDHDLLKLRLREHYHSTLSPVLIQASELMSTEDVRRVFLAARVILLHAHEERYLRDMQAMFDVLVSRGAATGLDARELYAAMVLLRRFEAAKRLAESHRIDIKSRLPTLRTLPEVQSPRYRVMAATSLDNLEIRHWAPPAGRSIVVVAGPDCARSRKAVMDITADADLAPIFENRSIWLAPPTLSADTGRTMDWLREGAQSNRFAVFAEEDWPDIDMYETPVFFVMEDGVVKKTIRGWLPPESMTELRNTLLGESRDISGSKALSPP
jgi:hypothetical protein